MGFEEFYTYTKLFNLSPRIVSIRGTQSTGQTLNCVLAAGWACTSYQWIKSNSDGTNPQDIAGETSSTYVISPSDSGFKISVRVTGLTFTSNSIDTRGTPSVVKSRTVNGFAVGASI